MRRTNATTLVMITPTTRERVTIWIVDIMGEIVKEYHLPRIPGYALAKRISEDRQIELLDMAVLKTTAAVTALEQLTKGWRR